MKAKVRLFVVRDNQYLELEDCNNFNASFNINAIGGTLQFDATYITPEVPTFSDSLGGFTVDRLKKFDFVFLYYYDSQENDEREDSKKWKQIFNGYIEGVRLTKNKRNIKYTITCNSMLALTSYYYTETMIGGEVIQLMPYKILQTANLQVGGFNISTAYNPRNFIPQELLDIQIEPEFARLVYPGTSRSNNAKDLIIDYKEKYGLIFTENMDGVIQVTSMSNYLAGKGDYRFKYKEEVKEPKERIFDVIRRFGLNLIQSTKGISQYGIRTREQRQELLSAISGRVQRTVIKASDVINSLGTPIILSLSRVADRVLPILSSRALRTNRAGPFGMFASGNPNVLYGLTKQILNESGLEEVKDIDLTPSREFEVLQFDVESNIYNLVYPDISTEYDGIVVVGLTTTGKAIDLTSIAMKGLRPLEDGSYPLNMLYLYRRDINDEFSLNRIAREELLKIKQENKIKFDTQFSPEYRIGMTFVVNDNDRYNGSEVFICTNIAYTIDKDDIVCTIEGSTSFLNQLPERLVTSDAYALDVIHLKLKNKIINLDWQNDWGV